MRGHDEKTAHKYMDFQTNTGSETQNRRMDFLTPESEHFTVFYESRIYCINYSQGQISDQLMFK